MLHAILTIDTVEIVNEYYIKISYKLVTKYIMSYFIKNLHNYIENNGFALCISERESSSAY